MSTWIRSHLIVVSVAATAVLAGLAWLAFGWFGVHTAFVDRTVDEALPTFERTADAGTTGVTEAVATEPAATEPGAPGSEDASGAVEAPAPEPDPEPEPEPEIAVEASGTFESLNRYTTVGEAVVLGDGSGQRFVRFEDFETSNGPDLNVYLVNSSTGDVSDFVDLGDLRGNIGSQNYEIPADVDLEVHDTVMIWCVRFSTGFGQAALSTSVG